MALTPFQREILLRLAQQRRARGESYVAGGIALNALLSAPRLSRDIDLFHDTETALAATWAADRGLLEASGFGVRPSREAASFVEAIVSKGKDRTAMQWARDSAFRFFPLIEDDTMGLALPRLMHSCSAATQPCSQTPGRLARSSSTKVASAARGLACGVDPVWNIHWRSPAEQNPGIIFD